MSVSRCMHHALAIAAQPDSGWGDAIARLPEACPHGDCSGGVGCRERVAMYLRLQLRMLRRRRVTGKRGNDGARAC